jgi:hypothetical protein
MSPVTMTREQIYDRSIAPLLDIIVAVCREYGIGMLADFEIPDADRPGLSVLSITPRADGSISWSHVNFVRANHGDPDSILVPHATPVN